MVHRRLNHPATLLKATPLKVTVPRRPKATLLNKAIRLKHKVTLHLRLKVMLNNNNKVTLPCHNNHMGHKSADTLPSHNHLPYKWYKS